MESLLNLLGTTYAGFDFSGNIDIGDLVVRVIGVLLVVILTRAVAGKVRGITTRRISKTRADAHTVWVMGRLGFFGTWLLGMLWVLGIAGVSWAALAATLGVIGIAISLSLQELLKNLVAGLYLLIERPFRVGEEIRIKDFKGVVESINLRTTLLRDADGQRGVVPNALFLAEIVINRPPGARKEILITDGADKEDKAPVAG